MTLYPMLPNETRVLLLDCRQSSSTESRNEY